MATTSMKVGRNELCSCGSGKKYKRCCGAVDAAAEDTASRFFGVAAVLAGIMAVVALAFGAGSLFMGDDNETKRVWSAEHGHYHTEGGSGEGGPGKVWNEEHGHYHDSAGNVSLESETPVEGALHGLRNSEIDALHEKAGAAPDDAGEADPGHGEPGHPDH